MKERFEGKAGEDPGDMEARLARAASLLRQSRFYEAILTLDSILLQEPANPGALYLKGVVFANLDAARDAVDCFNLALAADPDNSQTLFQKSNSLKAMGLMAEALESIEEAISLDRRVAGYWSLKGRILEEMERSEEAALCFEWAKKINDELDRLQARDPQG